MRLFQTDALVLHSFDYRETSRIVRLSTRDLGIVSAVARGARRSSARFGHGLDLFTSGVAQLALHPTRDLHALNAFDTTATRSSLAATMARFTAASALAEASLRFAREDESGLVHDVLTERLNLLAVAPPATAPWVALHGAWLMIAALGFGPSLSECASCHRALDPVAPVTFHHRAGGALCENCARTVHGSRVLPPQARECLLGWMSDGVPVEATGVGVDDTEPARSGTAPGTARELRAHQRLLREFLEEHVGDGRPLRAFLTWEQQAGDQS